MFKRKQRWEMGNQGLSVISMHRNPAYISWSAILSPNGVPRLPSGIYAWYKTEYESVICVHVRVLTVLYQLMSRRFSNLDVDRSHLEACWNTDLPGPTPTMSDSVGLGGAWESAFLSSCPGAAGLRQHTENNWTNDHSVRVSSRPSY